MPNQVGISRYNPKETKYKECPECEGKGYIDDGENYPDENLILCEDCGGDGQIEDESDEFDRADDKISDREFKEHFKN